MVLGHRWFQTVLAHAEVQDLDHGSQFDFCEFQERICLRCQKNEAVYIKKLDSWDIAYPYEKSAPTWLHQPPEYAHLPGDW